MNPKNLLKYLLVTISLTWYFLFYYYLDRSEFFFLISGVIIVGGIYFYWLKINSFTNKEIVTFAILFRVILLFNSPNFSDDCYRFVWDGTLVVEGVNPYEKTPTQLMNSDFKNSRYEVSFLYESLNSKDYYTVYPPLNQFFFSASVYLSGTNPLRAIFFMKIFILLFEVGIVFLLFRMLRKLKLKESLAQIYALNPLVILELTGNVHFEGVTIFFIMLGLYLILNHRIWLASIAIGLGISVKLVPLLLLPLFLPLLGLKKSIRLYLGIGITCLALIFPFITQTLIENFSESLNLYFQSFEFNASIYYLLKGTSHLFFGYKSSLIGVFIPLSVFIIALVFTYRLHKINKKQEFDLVLFANYATSLMFVFYLLASTVHPWYIINLVALSVFISRKTYLLWTLLILLSYFAYSNIVEENAGGDFNQYIWYYVVIGIEYSILLIFFIFESRKLKQLKHSQ